MIALPQTRSRVDRLRMLFHGTSIVISCAVASGGLSTATGMKARPSTFDAANVDVVRIVSIRFVPCPRSSATTQRRNKFAFSLLANATAAIDTPGLRQAAITSALNSALCLRRRRRALLPSSEVFTCPPRI